MINPIVTAITPKIGAAGTIITVIGTGLTPVTSLRVTLPNGGQNPLLIEPMDVRSDTMLQFVAPTALLGEWDLKLEYPGIVDVPDAFTETPQLEIYSYGSMPTSAQAALLAKVGGLYGLSFTSKWNVYQQSVKGPINWAPMAAARDLAKSLGLKLYPRINAGDGCPSDLPGMVTLPGSCFSSGPTSPAGNVVMPMPNSAARAQYYAALMQSFGAEFDGDPTISLVSASGVMRQGEMVQPSCPTWTELCAKYGLTPAVYEQVWKANIEMVHIAVPSHTLTLGVENTMGILQGLLGELAADGATSWLRTQQNGLRSTTNPTTNLLTGAKALGFKTGWQQWGSVAQGDGPLPTTMGIVKASGAVHLEMYEADVVNPANAALIAQYGAS